MRHRDEPITMIAGAATDGLGPAISTRLAQAHHRLALVDRRSKALRDLADGLKSDAASVRIQAGDVMHPRRIRHFVDDMLIHYGRVDNVVFVPDHATYAPFLETAESDLEVHLDFSLRGPWYWLHAAIPSMREHGGGRLVFLSTPAGRRGVGNMAAFSAAKGALHGLVQSVALEHHDDRVRPVCLVLDGPVDHEPMRAFHPDKTDWDDAITLDQVAVAVQDLLDTPLDDLPHEVWVRPKGA